MPKINQEEYEKIKLLPDYDWNWIAREKTGKILSFTNKPTKTDEVWKDKQTRLWFNYEDSQLFQFIQWKDEEPYEIAELIREYEIKELRLAPSGTVIVDSFDESEETEVLSQELPVIPEYVAEWITNHRDTYDLYPALRMLEHNTLVWGLIYEWYRTNTRKFVNAYLTGEYKVEEEPLYYALIKGHELVVDQGDWSTKYWKFDTSNGRVFPSHRLINHGDFLIGMSKSKWNKVGINDSNADFVKV